MRGTAAAAGVGHGIHAFADEDGIGRLICAGGLGFVGRALEQLGLELGSADVGLFHERHETVFAALGPDFLGQSKQAGVLHVLDYAVGDLGSWSERAEHEIRALEVLWAVGVVGADAAAGDEVDDAFLQNV